MKYSASFKLQVVKFASDNSNNSAASQKFGIDEKLVRDWRRKIDNIKSLPKTKCADRGRKCQWPELEKKVVKWVEENRKSGLTVTRNLIRLHAKKTAQQMSLIAMSMMIGLLPNSGRNSSVKAMMKKNSMAFEEKQTNKQRAPLGATKYEKRNDQCFIVLKLALELSKYRYRGYLFVFKIYCSNFILEFQIICLFYLTDEN